MGFRAVRLIHDDPHLITVRHWKKQTAILWRTKLRFDMWSLYSNRGDIINKRHYKSWFNRNPCMEIGSGTGLSTRWQADRRLIVTWVIIKLDPFPEHVRKYYGKRGRIVEGYSTFFLPWAFMFGPTPPSYMWAPAAPNWNGFWIPGWVQERPESPPPLWTRRFIKTDNQHCWAKDSEQEEE